MFLNSFRARCRTWLRHRARAARIALALCRRPRRWSLRQILADWYDAESWTRAGRWARLLCWARHWD